MASQNEHTNSHNETKNELDNTNKSSQYRTSDTTLGWSPVSERQLGQVLWFQPKKGYGMLRNLRSKHDIFVHQSALKTAVNVFRQLFPGEYVEYYEDMMVEQVNMSEEKSKLVAIDVTGIMGNMLMCEYQVLTSINNQNHHHSNSTNQNNIPFNNGLSFNNQCKYDCCHMPVQQQNYNRNQSPSYQGQSNNTKKADYPILVPQQYKHMISPEVVKTTYNQYGSYDKSKQRTHYQKNYNANNSSSNSK
jgi:cold shock CspA family protein